MNTRLTTALALAALAAPAAFAQQTVIRTDRPGLVPSTVTVPQGTVQVEVGALNAEINTENDAEFSRFNFPTTVRYGFTPGLEARLESTVYTFFSTDAAGTDYTADGPGTIGVGLKWTIPGGTNVNVVVMPRVTFALEDEPDAGLGELATGGPVYSTDFVAGFGLGTNLLRLFTRVGVDVAKLGSVNDPSDENYRALGRVAARLAGGDQGRGQVYGEAGYNTFQFSDFDKGNAYAGGGYKFTLAPNVMLDASYLYGFNKAATHNFSAGASVRF